MLTRVFITAILIIQTSVSLAAYDPNSTNALAGGYGYAAVSGDLIISSNSRTIADAGHPILTDGVLTEIKIRFHNGGSDCTMAKLKVLRGHLPNYSVVSTIDITSALNAARLTGDRFLFDLTGLNIAVQAGDIIGFYITPDEGSVNYVFKQSTSTDCVYENGDVSNLSNIYSDRAFYMDALVTTSNYVLYDNSNNEAGLTTANSPIFIPYFTDKNQYIILEGIDGINNYESLSIGLDTTTSTGESSTLDSIVISMVPSPAKGYISMTTGTKNRPLVSAAGHKFDLYIWTNNNTQRIEVLYVDRDLVPLYYSLTSRSPQYLAGCNTIRRLILSQGAGSSATIDRIVVCRQPVLAIGDSFVGTYLGTKVLTHVGAALDNYGVFTNRRYCINGGLSGNIMCYGTTNTYTIPDRWDGSGNMCAFRDVLVAFVNGPGLNDLASPVYTLALQREYTAGLIGALATMARKAMDDSDYYGGTNDIVFCQMIPYINPTYANAYNAQAIIDYNKEINVLGYYTNSPVASMAEFPLDYITSDGTHPTNEGSVWIASQIAMAYEHNTVPGVSPCKYSLAGDLNDDCKVDIYDFAQMASNWLTDCDADPNDPECYTK